MTYFYTNPTGTHTCTSGLPSDSEHLHRNLSGSVGSGRPLCVPDISDIDQWRGHIFPPHWSPRCRCSHTSHTVEPPRGVPEDLHSNRLRTSDSVFLREEQRWKRWAGIRWMTESEHSWSSCSQHCWVCVGLSGGAVKRQHLQMSSFKALDFSTSRSHARTLVLPVRQFERWEWGLFTGDTAVKDFINGPLWLFPWSILGFHLFHLAFSSSLTDADSLLKRCHGCVLVTLSSQHTLF